jgi:hypothetical protein
MERHNQPETDKKNRKDCGKREDSLNHTVKLRSGNNYGR